jgi:hypothetical protein
MIGDAYQSYEQWHDEFSTATGTNAAMRAADAAKRLSIPPNKLSVELVRLDHKGIEGHWDVTRAFQEGTHTDPGKNFPWEEFEYKTHEFYHGTSNVVQEHMMIMFHPTEQYNGHPAYYQVTSRGTVHPFGATLYGDLSKTQLVAPITDAAMTPSGKGYMLEGADGGLFAFGDAAMIGHI